MPSPRRRIVSRVCCSAWASRSARRAASAASAISGATTSRIRRPIRASSFGPNSPARSTRCASANATVSASTPVGERGEGAVDHPRLRQRRGALAHRRRQHRPLPVQRVGQAQVRARVGVRRPGVLRQPARRILRRGVSGEVTGVGEDPQPQLHQLSLRRRQLPQRRRLLAGRHERRVRVGDGLQHRPDVAGRSDDRVRHHGPPPRRRTGRPRTRDRIDGRRSWRPGSRAITHPRNSPSKPGLSALVTASWWPGSVGERATSLPDTDAYSQVFSILDIIVPLRSLHARTDRPGLARPAT